VKNLAKEWAAQHREKKEKIVQEEYSQWGVKQEEMCENTSTVDREKAKYVNSLLRVLKEEEEEVIYDALIKIEMYKDALSKYRM
jgi:ABC-type phosphate/phosphonate transport system ATPase subunit